LPLFLSIGIFPLEGKNRLALWGQVDAEESLRSRQVKNVASAGTSPKSAYGFGAMGCKVTVAEFTA
jgi:hypothetical protein